jgi:CelD/BcsL family acetyltransferase involved in cellulose biosynthesis
MSEARELQVELVTNRSAVPLSAEQWNALASANETNTVFQTYEWFDAWWRSFGTAHGLFLLVVRDGANIIGFVALTLSRGAWGWRELRFAGAGNADYQDFVLPTRKADAIAAICRFLQTNWLSWDRMAFGGIPSHSSTLPLLTEAAVHCGLHLVDEARVTCPTLLLQEDPSRARRLIDKYSLRRPHNWFSKRGAVNFRHVKSVEEVEALLPAFFDQHRSRWRAAGKPSLFNQPRQMKFYAELARTLQSRGWLQFSVLEFNGEPIAFHFGFDYCGCVTWYKPSFDVRYAEHSPGLLLTRQLIEDGLRRERVELDFTAGDEAFKGRFASRERYNIHFGVYHGRVGFGIALAIRSLRRLAGRTLRWLRSPRVTGAAVASALMQPTRTGGGPA